MFNMLMGASRRSNRLSGRAFSTSVATAQTGAPAAGVQTLWQYSEKLSKEAAAKEAGEAAYLDTLKTYSTVPGAYTKLSETGSSDHLKQIRKRINKVVEQEIGLIEFKNQVSGEELAQSAYDEVITKENFFFKIDEQKKARNMKVYNMEAPGNKFRKPAVILAHEHISPSHYIDVDGNDADQMMEIYGHYAYLIDMHIAQVRPENLNEKSYIPAKYNQVAHMEKANYHLDNMNFEFYHRWREPTRTWYSQTQHINH